MKKITINLNLPIKNLLTGNEVEPRQTLGEAVAVHLSMASTANAAKSILWALELHKGLTIELDEIDFGVFYEFCSNLQVSNMFKVQLLEVLDMAKNKK